ncbi:MAG: lactonase family protein [Verrucomicrobia bacterium]|nr:lactonase family protein [Verrucomicrobiota bacterium]
MNTPRFLLAAFAALLVGCQSADTPAPAPKAAAKAAPKGKAKPAPAQYVFYVGTSGPKAQGVLRCVLDGKTGKISAPTVAAEAKSASYVALSLDAKFLYATAEAAEGAVAAYAVEGDKLRLLNTEASKGKGPTHLAVDAVRRNLVVVNYGSGSTTSLPIKADGSLAPATSSVQHVGSGPNAGRQSGPHAHGAYFHPKSGRVYVADLGTDDIFIYKFDAEKGLLAANKPKSGRVAAGAGPRHLAFHPNGKFAYVNNEMALTVTAFTVERNGGLKEFQTLDTLPAGADKKGVSTAEIFVRPDGKTLYVSNRGHDSLAVYSIAQDGKLALLQHVLGTPATPRGFGLSADGRWLVCAGQKSGTLNAYKIGRDGKLTDTKQAVEAPAAAAVVFVP